MLIDGHREDGAPPGTFPKGRLPSGFLRGSAGSAMPSASGMHLRLPPVSVKRGSAR